MLGAGAIGLLWTASIRSKFPTYPITLLLRDHDRNRKRVENLPSDGSENSNEKKNGHRLSISWNNRHLVPAKHPSEQLASTPIAQQVSLPVQFIDDPKHGKERIKTLVVATKAHQAKQAVESVMDRLVLCDGHDNGTDNNRASSSQIIVLCNGALSVREELSEILPQTQGSEKSISLALATTTHGAYLSEPDKLVHAGLGMTFLDQTQQPKGGGLVDLWNQAGLKCASVPSEQMNSLLWSKLAANCVINPLTSIFRCTNGELLLEPTFPALKEEILAEVARVALGKAEQDLAEQSQNNKSKEDIEMSGVPTIDEMRDFVSQTIRDTVHNKSSMYQDIINGQRRKTEIGQLNGYVVRKGRELGYDCPANDDLCSRIAELTARN